MPTRIGDFSVISCNFETPHPRERTVKEGKIETPPMFETLRKSVEMLAPAMRRR
jgi:hypothetical protein